MLLQLCALGRNGSDFLLPRTPFSCLLSLTGRFGVDVPIGAARLLATPDWHGQVEVNSL